MDFPRAINIYVASDTSAGSPTAGYAWAPGSYTNPLKGHIFLLWNTVAASGWNSLPAYNGGAVTTWHELAHHLGLQHSFGTNVTDTCSDGDYVSDTPSALGEARTKGLVHDE